MKTINRLLMVAFAIILFTNNVAAQEEEPPLYLTVTTMHWNMDMEDFKMDEWKAVEKEYFDKVIMKNQYMLASDVGMHYFTDDNTELVRVFLYQSWGDIEKAQKRSRELEKEAWPDEAKRKEYFKKMDNYFEAYHSDEIFVTMPGAKEMTEPIKQGQLYYVQNNHFAFPETGSPEEFMALNKEYVENVIHKNDFIKGYYPHRHAWGSDRTDFMEVFVVESLADLDKALKNNEELYKKHWPDEAKRKEYDKKVGKYLTGKHSDGIYSAVPELTKPYTPPMGTN